MTRSTLRAVVLLVLAAAVALAGCASTIKKKVEAEAGKHGVEVIAASLTGSKALAVVNSNSPNGPAPVFPTAYFGGAVLATQSPFPLGGGNGPTGVTTFRTTAGNLTVTHTDSPGYGANAPKNAPPKTKFKLKKSECYYTSVFDKGTFVANSGTGKFATVSGHGVFTVLILGRAPLKSGQTACSFSTIGASTQATINFAATGKIFK